MDKNKENASSHNNRVDERRKQLEAYIQAKKEKKEAARKTTTKPNDRGITTLVSAPKKLDNQNDYGKSLSNSNLTVECEKLLGESIPTESTSCELSRNEIFEASYPDPNQNLTICNETNPTPPTNADIQELYEAATQDNKENSSPISPLTKEGILMKSREILNNVLYLKCGNLLIRVPKQNHLRLFKLDQIEECIKRGNFDLARIMLTTIGAPNQAKQLNSCYNIDYWNLYFELYKNDKKPLELINRASEYLREEQLNLLISKLNFVGTPEKSIPSKENLESPSTPEMTIPSILFTEKSILKTPDSDEQETLRMQSEIDEVVRRTPAIQKVTPPKRKNLIDQSMSLIKETSLYSTSNSHSNTPTKPKLKVEGGSTYLYALITPNKKIQQLMDSDQVISPVRRSSRILSHKSPGKEKLFETLNDVPDLAEVGFLPNSNVVDKLSQKRSIVKLDSESYSNYDTPKKRPRPSDLTN